MTELGQAHFEGWAVVEVMGHQRFAGHVKTEAYGQAVLFRVDVPELPEREYVLESPEWVGSQLAKSGSKVIRKGAPGFSKLIGAGSIYAITPCDEQAAMRAVESINPRPLRLVQLAESQLLEAQNGGGSPSDEDEEGDKPGGDDDDEPF